MVHSAGMSYIRRSVCAMTHRAGDVIRLFAQRRAQVHLLPVGNRRAQARKGSAETGRTATAGDVRHWVRDRNLCREDFRKKSKDSSTPAACLSRSWHCFYRTFFAHTITKVYLIFGT